MIKGKNFIYIRKNGYKHLLNLPLRKLKTLEDGRIIVVAEEHKAFTRREVKSTYDSFHATSIHYPKNSLTGTEYILSPEALEVS